MSKTPLNVTPDPATQKAFYAEGEHEHLLPQVGDLYANNIAERLVAATGIESTHNVLEIGASFGRFTFPLAEHCSSIVALDLSSRVLGALAGVRDERGISSDRIRTHCADAQDLTVEDLGGSVDAVVGFFILHHIPDYPATIRRLARLIKPGGTIAFVEPNRRNPLFLAQVLACRDMSWRAEKGMFTLGYKHVERAYRDSGLTDISTSRFGFFPPQLFNNFGWSRSLEATLEGASPLEPVLPFLLMTARVPSPNAGVGNPS